MHFVIITGLSGAGKSTAVKCLEDLGYFCIDNLPPTLLPKFAEVCSVSEGKIDKVAIVVHARVGYLLKDIFTQLQGLKDMGHSYEIIFLEASDNVLIKRYKETRRMHPLSRGGRIARGIKEERILLEELRQRANHIIDTSNFSSRQLSAQIKEIFAEGEKFEGLVISVTSFGFKYGFPADADLMFDVRFIPNPFYIETLKRHNGKNEKVREYVFSFDQTNIFVKKLLDMLEFLIPNYIKEGKTQMVIAIGCTGGQHRSVAIAEKVYEELVKAGHKAVIDHRDIEKDNKRSRKV